MPPQTYQLDFVWLREDEEGVELVPLAEASSPLIPRIGEGVEFDLPEAQSDEMPDSWIVVDLRYVVERGDAANHVSPRVTVFVDAPLEEDEDE